uniref:Uncharacterized protein n=1 Tax=Oryza sativa subsp. japonica TaxID=39947 RepID=Q6YWZ2_ORYSJ|nr:hypothetical protein [Oryza sativa Japonica Group]BAC99888.1 hypothetical protein [Oryza sativa Japonica Group]
MDLGKSASTSATLKKLQEDGALPGRGTMEREAGASVVLEVPEAWFAVVAEGSEGRSL